MRRLLKLMLDAAAWGERHGDHSAERCESCELASIWFRLARLLVDCVYPDGESYPEEDTLIAIAFGRVQRSNTVASIKSSGGGGGTGVEGSGVRWRGRGEGVRGSSRGRGEGMGKERLPNRCNAFI